MSKGFWIVVSDNSKLGYHFHCIRCKEDGPAIKGTILNCLCDLKDEILTLPAEVNFIKMPLCKRTSTGGCCDCSVPCCKEK
jgi:hypothetical protein